MSIKITNPFSPLFEGPVDSRSRVQSLSHLDQINGIYSGQMVYVEDNQAFYVKKRKDMGWEPFSGGSGGDLLMRITSSHIQWQRTSEGVWRDLISVEDLSRGPKGDTGAPITLKGVVADYTFLPTNALAGDAWFTTSGDLYYRFRGGIGQAWVYCGNLKGPQGNPGINLKGSIAVGDPLPVDAEGGDAYVQGASVWIKGDEGWVEMDAIVGPQGPQGPQGPVGPMGEGLHIDFFADDVADLNPISNVGEIALVGDVIYRFDGYSWVEGPSLKGDKGDGVVISEYASRYMDLSEPTEKNLFAMVGTDIYVSAEESEGVFGWSLIGNIKGPKGDGLSFIGSYDSIENLPGGYPQGSAALINGQSMIYVYDGAEWQASAELTGPQGIPGDEGEKGEQGDQGEPFTIAATFAEGAFPSEPEEKRFYLETTNQKLYYWSGTDWIDYGSIRGEQGETGPRGEQGVAGITVKGSAESIEELNASTPAHSVEVGDAYVVNGDFYISDGVQWQFISEFRGPIGPQGEIGPVGPQGEAGITVKGTYDTIENLNAGDPPSIDNIGDAYVVSGDLYISDGTNWNFVSEFRGPQGIQGEIGPRGPAGLNIKPPRNDLPDFASAETWDAYLFNSGNLYAKLPDTLDWTLLQNLKGPQGDRTNYGIVFKQGETRSGPYPNGVFPSGDVGDAIFDESGRLWNYQTWLRTNGESRTRRYGWIHVANLPIGPRGAPGTPGTDGVDGQDGKDLTIAYSFETLAQLQAVTTAQDGDIGLAGDQLYVYGAEGWQGPSGSIRGPKGDEGDIGPAGPLGINILSGGPYATIGALPTAGVNDKDAYFLTDGTLCIRKDGSWHTLVNLIGPQGLIGPRGPAGLNVKGTVDTLPSFAASEDWDAYFTIGGNLYIKLPSTSSWSNFGNFKGPKGDGLFIDGVAASFLELPDPATTSNGAVYVTNTDSRIYINQSGSWVYLGETKGDKGDKGDTGPVGGFSIIGELATALDIPSAASSEVGDTYLVGGSEVWVFFGGSVGWKVFEGIVGPRGPAGLNMKGTFSSMLDFASAEEYDAFFLDNGVLWAKLPSNTSNWTHLGAFMGPVGPVGANFKAGPVSSLPTSGAVNRDVYFTQDGSMWIRDDGAWIKLAELKGPKGDKGDPGQTGSGLALKGVRTDYAALPIYGNITGDVWYTQEEEKTWIWQDGSWVELGNVKGPKGEDGTSVKIRGTILAAEDLSAKIGDPTNAPGDGWIIAETGALFVWDEEAGIFVYAGIIKGPKGDEGPVGPSGINFKGQKADFTELQGVASPVQNDAYFLPTGELYIFRAPSWELLTNLRGPIGIGVPAGGATNQVLKKVSGASYHYTWSSADSLISAEAVNGLITQEKVKELIAADLDKLNWSDRMYTASGNTINVLDGGMQYLTLSGDTEVTLTGFNDNYKIIVLQVEKGTHALTFSNAITWWTNNGNPPPFASYTRLRVSLDSPNGGTTINGTLIGGII